MFRPALQSLRDGLLSLVYPQECRVCGGAVESWRDGVVCDACWQNPAITDLFLDRECCRKCGAVLPAIQTFEPPPGRADGERQCGRCHGLPIARARACGAYVGALAANVNFLKSQPHLCPRLRQVIAQALAAERKALESDLIVPVPLHADRRAERGFNQAEVLASFLASHLGRHLQADLLRRPKYTERHRAGLDAIDRARSVDGAFVVGDRDVLRGQTILLVDDLFTTGSTVGAAAETLLAAGAAEVRVFTIARVRGGQWRSGSD